VESVLYIYTEMNIKRIIPIGVSALGVIVAGIGIAGVDGFVTELGAAVVGLGLFGAGYLWYQRQWERSDEVRVDERVEHIAYRSGELAFRVSLGIAMALFVVLQVDSVPVTAKEGLVVLILSMVVVRFGLYGWFRQQSV